MAKIIKEYKSEVGDLKLRVRQCLKKDGVGSYYLTDIYKLWPNGEVTTSFLGCDLYDVINACYVASEWIQAQSGWVENEKLGHIEKGFAPGKNYYEYDKQFVKMPNRWKMKGGRRK